MLFFVDILDEYFSNMYYISKEYVGKAACIS